MLNLDEYIIEISRVKAEATSPSRAVLVTIDRRKVIEVSLDGYWLKGMDEDRLAEEIEACVAESISTYHEQCSAILSNVEEPFADYGNFDYDQWRDELQEGLQDIEVPGKSQNGHVEVVLYGDGDLTMRIRNNAVRRKDITNELLQYEINDAIKQARKEYSEIAARYRMQLSERLIDVGFQRH